MERLKSMKETLTSVVQAQMGNLSQVDTKELGEAVDMLKDLSEAVYYCCLTEQLEAQKKERKERPSKEKEYHYYHENPYQEQRRYNRDMDKGMGMMYYSADDNMMYYGGSGSGSSGGGGSSGGSSSGGGGSRSYTEQMNMRNYGGGNNYARRNYEEFELPFDFRDEREGKAPNSRRTYMESKELHKDQIHKMKDLEKYLQDLSDDIIEMIKDSSPEERKVLEKKISALAQKVGQLN